MLVWSRTLLREVLLSWMSKLLGQHPLELRAVEAGGAAEQGEARRIEDELVLVPGIDGRLSRSLRRRGSPRIPDARYSAGTISSLVAMLKYFEISGCVFISRRSRISESSIDRLTSS